ncbi:MAG: hypothetical protein QXI33_02990 [Candidatus Pacearchaeota archaeon]
MRFLFFRRNIENQNPNYLSIGEISNYETYYIPTKPRKQIRHIKHSREYIRYIEKNIGYYPIQITRLNIPIFGKK